MAVSRAAVSARQDERRAIKPYGSCATPKIEHQKMTLPRMPAKTHLMCGQRCLLRWRYALAKAGQEWHKSRRQRDPKIAGAALTHLLARWIRDLDRTNMTFKIQIDYDTDAKFAFDLIRQAAWGRNLEVVDHARRVYTIRDGSGKEVNFARATPGNTTVFAQQCMANKTVSKRLLRAAGVRVAEGKSFYFLQKKAAWEFAQSIGGPFVVKPVSGEGGKGVTTNITSEAQFDLAWEKVRPLAKFGILIEEFITGGDHRIVVIGDTVAAALRKWPLYLRGDGVSTVAQLIEKKRQERLLNAFTKKKKFEISRTVRQTMKELGLTDDSVIEAGRYVELDTVGNLAAGGESEDIPVSRIHPDFIEAAVKARKCMPGIEICGIDLLAEDVTKSPDGQSWAVCELNMNADFGLNHFPVKGEPRDVAGMLVEHYFPKSAEFLTRPVMEAAMIELGDKLNPQQFARLTETCILQMLSGGVVERGEGGKAVGDTILVMGPPTSVRCFVDMIKAGDNFPTLNVKSSKKADLSALPDVKPFERS
ncbi:hypothetical protein ACFORG_01595 [Lutimaribacter marinistellae]|uniref:ATP-grasp domain-containing protein n=1 Tax=Lutimaribacter marinistellae TaxID=1820329 RepID=A0ABV7TC43_9RHOB